MKKDFIRYICVGIGANVVNFATYLLLKQAGTPLFWASATGYIAGIALSYHFGRVWVFGHIFGLTRRNLALFIAVYATGGLGMSAIIAALTNKGGVDYRLSWLCGAGFAVLNNFLGQKRLVFNKGETPHEKG